jgi:hypothetical protein
MLISDEYSFSVAEKVDKEHEKTPQKLFNRLEKEAKEKFR